MSEVPLYKQHLPPGIQIRKSARTGKESIRLRFTYQGQQCHETLKGKRVSKSSIEFAKRKLAQIQYEIAEGTFDYAAHFPGSKRAIAQQPTAGERTVAEGVEIFLARKRTTLAPSGFRMYRSRAEKHVLPRWGHYRIKDIRKTELEQWQTQELPMAGLSDKTINQIFIIIRGVFDDAVGDQIIAFNPLTIISNLESAEDDNEADPFSQEELDRLLSLKTDRQQEINAYGFNSRAGLRESELMGLAWEDIDTSTWRVKIQRGRVAGEYRVPKTRDSLREFQLQPEAIVWLKRQMAYTAALPPVEVKVRQRNHRDFETVQLRFVFHNSRTGAAWTGDTVFRKVFHRILRQAGVRIRGANQLRHTFASWLLTHAVPLEWIAPIMGTSVAMLRKHYAKIIVPDQPDFAGLITSLLRGQSLGLVEARGRRVGN